jgi:inward rectifier potassium channel
MKRTRVPATKRTRPPAIKRIRTPEPALRTEPLNGVVPPAFRLIARNREDQILAIGLHRPWFGDLYHRALTIGWWRFLLVGSVLYIGANLLFALLYLVDEAAIANARPGSFADAFFFSVQTMATIGYGQMSPATVYANLIVTAETLFGLIFLGLAAGLAFARFSRPTARILFSRVAVIGPYNGKPTLSVRLANERRNQILQAEVMLTFVCDEPTAEGGSIRRFYDLKLARHRTPIFAMTFRLMHEIDPTSPFYGATATSLAAQNAELVATATGLDETTAQRVHARTSYLADEILWNRRFADIIGWTEDGRRAIDYRRFHDTVELG